MNAVISGSSATALLIDGERLTSIHADAIDTPVLRKPADLPFLFGEGNDLQFLENVTYKQVTDHLRSARDKDDALQLTLILLDKELSKKVRQGAAEALEELLNKEFELSFGNLPNKTSDKLPTNNSVSEYLQNVLYAHPLSKNADLDGAKECCELGSAVLVQYFLEKLQELQPIIHEAYLAWEAIPDATFGATEARAQYHAVAINQGLFQDFVKTIADGENESRFLSKSLQKSAVKKLPKSKTVLHDWIVRHESIALNMSPAQAIKARVSHQLAVNNTDRSLESVNLRRNFIVQRPVSSTLTEALQAEQEASGFLKFFTSMFLIPFHALYSFIKFLIHQIILYCVYIFPINIDWRGTRRAEFQTLTALRLSFSIGGEIDIWRTTPPNIRYSERGRQNTAYQERSTDIMVFSDSELELFVPQEFPVNLDLEIGVSEHIENLQRTVAVYEADLRDRKIEKSPKAWAIIQNKLGNAYAALSAGDRNKNLKKAVKAYKSAIRVLDDEDFPENWAMAKINLGTAYRNLQTGNRAQNLLNAFNAYKAVKAYKAALHVLSQEDFHWAFVQYSLGLVYRDLPTGNREKNLQKTMTCFKNALRIWAKDRFPDYYKFAIEQLERVQDQLKGLLER